MASACFLCWVIRWFVIGLGCGVICSFLLGFVVVSFWFPGCWFAGWDLRAGVFDVLSVGWWVDFWAWVWTVGVLLCCDFMWLMV